MTIGAIPLGLLFAAISYAVTRWAVSAFQARRHARLAEKARRAANADARHDPAVLQS
jgi:uncharacterized protein (DUF2062 family)